MKFIFIFMLTNSMMSMYLNHPISLGSMLMIQSMFSSLFVMLLTNTSWYSMILFITFSSGMMIMFMYMSSISSNEKFNWSMKFMIMIMLTFLLIQVLKMDKTILFKNKWMTEKEKDILLNENEQKISIMKMLTVNKFKMTILMTIVILLLLMAISNLINSFEGPLKMTYVKR